MNFFHVLRYQPFSSFEEVSEEEAFHEDHYHLEHAQLPVLPMQM